MYRYVSAGRYSARSSCRTRRCIAESASKYGQFVSQLLDILDVSQLKFRSGLGDLNMTWWGTVAIVG